MRQLRLAVAIAFALVAAAAQARSGYGTTMTNRYPNIAGTKLDSCATCHGDSKSARNSYGAAYEAELLRGVSELQSFINIEPLDSDGDGYTNLAEFQALTYPGDAADKPGAVTYCADADNDGFAVCSAGCTLAAGDVCGDCNDASAAVSPSAAEGPYGAAVCADGVDNNCNAKIDAADPGCAPPAPTYCPDADADGFAVCSGSCTLAAGDTCGDCNDAAAGVNPAALEEPFGSAVCADAIDNDCDAATDAADPGCAPPANTDYDITSFFATGAVKVRGVITLQVGVASVGLSDAGGRLKVTGLLNGKVIPIADQAISGSATYTFSYTAKATGTIEWTVEVTDADADADVASATTIVTRK